MGRSPFSAAWLSDGAAASLAEITGVTNRDGGLDDVHAVPDGLGEPHPALSTWGPCPAAEIACGGFLGMVARSWRGCRALHNGKGRT